MAEVAIHWVRKSNAIERNRTLTQFFGSIVFDCRTQSNPIVRLVSIEFDYRTVEVVSSGSAKSASQRAMRATVRAMRVTRVMRVMRATVQMLRIFICFIYIRVRKFWTNFFLFFFFRFCYNFGENFAYSKSPKMRKKIKTIRKNLLRFKTSEKKSEKNIRQRQHHYSNRYLLIHVIH